MQGLGDENKLISAAALCLCVLCTPAASQTAENETAIPAIEES